MAASMANEVIYIIEDEGDIAKLIRYILISENFSAECFSTGESGLKAIGEKRPDLIILDLMLPGISGIEICRSIKNDPATKSVPIIMLTAKGEESDIVLGLEAGADDYVTKPFSPKVLAARVSAVLRRSKTLYRAKEEVIKLGELSIHPGRHEVVASGEKIDLTHSEFQILHKLARKPGWVYTRAQIVEAIRGDNYAVTERTIDFQMVGLRKKLGNIGSHIETVRGVGYKFKEL